VHVSHCGRRALPKPFADEVNRWAFVSEKVLHGNPSGVDNSVAVYGGALGFTRAGFRRKGGLESIQGCVFNSRGKLNRACLTYNVRDSFLGSNLSAFY
jgi:hypothetical protein